NLLTVEEALQEHYNVFTLTSVTGMFELLEHVAPHLILLDIEMPGTDGFKALEQLKTSKQYANIPVIFLTGRRDSQTEVRGFEMGVIDFVTKPFSKPVLLNRIKTHLNIEEIIQERTEKLQRVKNSIVSTLANMVESRDILTGKHIENTAKYMRIFLNAMFEHKVYFNEISNWDLEIVISATRLHDIGKIAVPDLILNKTECLTKEEFEIMKTHAAKGEAIIDNILEEAGNDDLLQNAKLLVGYHHEYWDGTGYPQQLAGEDIPLQGRVMALVDVYDALVSERPYKPAFTHEKATKIIIESKGKQFDPSIVDVFLKVSDQFAKVRGS
ncbi:MAG: response regulator, partial [Fibromonadales bacterium]|nr:response regulator [Fibromonadales bacterium]